MLYEKGAVKYDMKLDNTKKTFHLYADGFFTEEDGNSFLNDYNRLVKTFKTGDYNLIIDGSKLKPSSVKVSEILGMVLNRYMEVPFNRRFLITEANPITVSQFKRLGTAIPGWTESIEYVDTVKDVYNML